MLPVDDLGWLAGDDSFGGPTNFNGSCFETYTWAAGVAAMTERAAVFSTAHVPTVHPIMAAKQATTIDHISNGRFALNVVCGWFQPELEMFGAPIMEHDTRYEYAAEWLEIVRRLWTTEEEFDYEGRFFRIQKGFHEPKPIQRPFPPIMNAGGSPRGQRFAAQHADMAFIVLQQHTYDAAKAQIDSLRRLAREKFGLVGTPAQIVDTMDMLTRAGLDGVVLSWVNYQVELQQWIDEVLPLMEQAGLRRPFRPGA